MDTIFALSSGAPPAGIAVVRISGPKAGTCLATLAGALPAARRARLVELKAADGRLLDQALVLWFPGPATATGEDLAELHLHGGRAVVAAVEAELGAMPGLRHAEAGEFTRRAFANGRMDLAEAEGLGDLLTAETELQRQAAIGLLGGNLSRQVESWRERLLHLSAMVEAALDFGDEDDVPESAGLVQSKAASLRDEIAQALANPSAEKLRDGFRVALAGPPNAGKSTLFNALVEQEAAITSPYAGTTRDVLTASVALAGIPFNFVDMAGLREDAADPVEEIGIARATQEIETADLVLWLGEEGKGPDGAWEIEAKTSLPNHAVKQLPRHRLSAQEGDGMDGLRIDLIATAKKALPKPGQTALNKRQRALLDQSVRALADSTYQHDPLLVAESFRQCRVAFDRLVGRSATEDVLDTLFGRFCIGK